MGAAYYTALAWSMSQFFSAVSANADLVPRYYDGRCPYILRLKLMLSLILLCDESETLYLVEG